jgi:hypothetical protein
MSFLGWTIRLALKHGHVQIAKWLLLNYNINILEKFHLVCISGNVEVAKWLLEVIPNIQEEFLLISCNCNVEEAKWLLSMYHHDTILFKQFGIGFYKACFYGHLELAKWLFEITPAIVIAVHCDIAFRTTCERGHLELAKWLLELNPDMKAYCDESFRNACEEGHLELAEWFQSLNPDKYIILDDERKDKFKFIPYKIIQQLTIQNTIVKKEKEKCTICSDYLEEINTNCGHIFCKDCITHYYLDLDNNSCPYCRQIITHFIKVV